MNYKYITEDNLEKKQTYMYAEYGGEAFLEAYVNSREQIIEDVKLIWGGVKHNTYAELKKIWEELRNTDTMEAETKQTVDMYVKAFEVRKRLYTGYDERWKPCREEYRDYGSYLLFGHILEAAYHRTDCLKYVSCLLKLTDSLISVSALLREAERYELAFILDGELEIYREIKKTGGNR